MFEREIYDGMVVLGKLVAKSVGGVGNCENCIFSEESVCLPCVSDHHHAKETHYIWIAKEQE